MPRRMNALVSATIVGAVVLAVMPASAANYPGQTGCGGGAVCAVNDTQDPAFDNPYDPTDPVFDALPDPCDDPTVGDTAACSGGIDIGTDLESYRFEKDSFDTEAGAAGQIHGGSALKATFVVDGVLPAEDDPLPPSTDGDVTGWSYHAYYRDTQLLDNRPHNVCPRNTSTDVAPTYLIAGYFGHHEDQFFFRVGLQYNYVGPTGYVLTPVLGWFDPSADGGFIFIDVANQAGAKKAPSMNGKGDWFVKVDRNVPVGKTTLTVKIVNRLPYMDINCHANPSTLAPANRTNGAFPGGGYYEFGLPGKPLEALAGAAWLNTIVRTPMTIPASIVPGESDIDSLGGLVTLVDIITDTGGNNAYVPGFTQPNLGPGDAPGPTCWTPTFGGTLPRNPLWVGGEPCQIPSPVGDHWVDTGLSISL